MTLPVTFGGTAGNDITTEGFTKYSGDTGSLIISNAGRCRPVTNSATVEYLWPTDTPSSADYWVEADYVFLSNTTVQRCGVIGRASDAARTFYMARIYNIAASTSNVQLFKAVAGTFTQLGSNYAVSSSGTYTIRLDMSGSTIRALVNGVERISVTDTSITAAGKIGFYHSGDTQSHSNTTGFHIDNLTASFASAGNNYTQSMSAATTRSVTIDKGLSLSQALSAATSRSASATAATVIRQTVSASTSRAASMIQDYIMAPIQGAVQFAKGVVQLVASVIKSPLDR